MAILTRARDTKKRDTERLSYPVAANARIFAGGLVVLNAGHAEPARTAVGRLAAGRAAHDADNTGGAAGARAVEVERGCFRWAQDGTITQADVGLQCFIVDDQTVAKADGGGTRSPAGIVRGVESGGVWVET